MEVGDIVLTVDRNFLGRNNMAKMTYLKAASIIDRILDEDYHVYTKEAIDALEMAKIALKNMDTLDRYMKGELNERTKFKTRTGNDV